MAYSWNIGVFQADDPGSAYQWNIGADQTSVPTTPSVELALAGGFTGGGSLVLGTATPVSMSISGGFTGGGSIVLGVATAENISLSGGFTGGGALFLLGSSAWAGNYDTKQYVVAFGNNQVWYCEV